MKKKTLNKDDLQKYLTELDMAMKHRSARTSYFPAKIDHRKEANLLFARDLGFGLKDFNPKDVDAILGTLYGTFIVSNSLDSTGVAIDNKEFLAHVNKTYQSWG